MRPISRKDEKQELATRPPLKTGAAADQKGLLWSDLHHGTEPRVSHVCASRSRKSHEVEKAVLGKHRGNALVCVKGMPPESRTRSTRFKRKVRLYHFTKWPRAATW